MTVTNTPPVTTASYVTEDTKVFNLTIWAIQERNGFTGPIWDECGIMDAIDHPNGVEPRSARHWGEQ
jgi:hypothetical protein